MQDGPLEDRYTVIRKSEAGDIIKLGQEVLERFTLSEIGQYPALRQFDVCLEAATMDPRRYFVLSMDTDPGGKPALRAYVEFIKYTHPQLAEVLREEYDLDMPDYYTCLYCRGRAHVSIDAWDIGASSRVWLECDDCSDLYPIERKKLTVYGGYRET
jgi:hypothetical protein